MKKYLVLMVTVALVIVSLSSCKTTSGLRVYSDIKKNVHVAGMKNVDNFVPGKAFILSDSLSTNSVPRPATAMVNGKKSGKKDEYIFSKAATNPIEIVFYQTKSNPATNLIEDYAFAFKAIPIPGSKEYKIVTLIDGSRNYVPQDKIKKQKSKSANRSQALRAGGDEDINTFNIRGTEIRAHISNDTTVAHTKPCKLSFFIDNSEPLTLIQYAYNNKDIRSFDFDDPDQFTVLDNEVYIKTINLNYGDRFSIETADGRTPDISPEKLVADNIKLRGVELIRNPVSSGGFYVFRVIQSGTKAKVEKNEDVSGEKEISEDNETYMAGTEDLLNKGSWSQARALIWKNYPNGLIRVNVIDIIKKDYDKLFYQLASEKDKNGQTAIGLGNDGKLFPTVAMRPEHVKQYPLLWEIYKNKIVRK